jgi:hypothetical protein
MSPESELDELESQLHSAQFHDRAKDFEARFRHASELTREQRSALWQRYQDLWTRRKSWSESRTRDSQFATERYLDKLMALDYSYDGFPIGQSFSNWQNVGHKIRAARETLKAMRVAVKDDPVLVGSDRKKIFSAIDTTWAKIKSAEDSTFSIHRDHANRLYDRACEAVDSLPVREAVAIYKSAQAELKTLWLPKLDRDKYFQWFDTLWQRIQGKREDAKRRHDDWRSRQEEGIRKLESALEKAESALQRTRENVRNNYARLSDARGYEYRERVSEWIREGEQREREIENSVEQLRVKVRDAWARLERK